MQAVMAEKWSLEGTVFDACNCTTLCPCNYAQDPTEDDCRVTVVWKIQKGSYGKTKLDGLMLASVMYASGNPLLGIDKMAAVLDEKATPAQREALGTILSGKVGGLFGMLVPLVKQNLGASFGKFAYKNDAKAWSVDVDGKLHIRGGFVKAPPGAPIKSAPKRAQTYDFLFGPTMEKTVGIADSYRANVAGLDYDVRGKYSSAGRFKYTGP